MPSELALSFPAVSASCYCAPTDRACCALLASQLAPLILQRRLLLWDEQQVLAGQEVRREREQHLKTDRLLIFFISADFLASEVCQEQMEVALGRQERAEATVIPVVVRPCLWQATVLRTLQVLPREEKYEDGPLPEAVWREIAAEIRQVVEAMQRWT